MVVQSEPMNKMSVRGKWEQTAGMCLKKNNSRQKKSRKQEAVSSTVILGGGVQHRWRYRSECKQCRRLFDKTGHERKRTCSIRRLALIQFPCLLERGRKIVSEGFMSNELLSMYSQPCRIEEEILFGFHRRSGQRDHLGPKGNSS